MQSPGDDVPLPRLVPDEPAERTGGSSPPPSPAATENSAGKKVGVHTSYAFPAIFHWGWFNK